MSLTRTTCCGVRDYEGVLDFDTSKEVMLDLANDMFGTDGIDGAYILMTCPVSERKIPSLIKFIHKHKLGECTLAPWKRNPNSGNNLYAMLFAPDNAVFRKWYYLSLPKCKFKRGDKVVNCGEGERVGRSAVVISTTYDTYDEEWEVRVEYATRESGWGSDSDYKLAK